MGCKHKIDYFKYTSIYNGQETFRINNVTVTDIIDNPHVGKQDKNKWCQFNYYRSDLEDHIHCPINLSETMIDPDLVEVNSVGDLVYRIHRDVRGHLVVGMWYLEKNKEN